MTVQDLRETLTRLVGLLAAADAKAATTKGLTEFVEATAGFGDLTLKQFVKLAEDGRAPKERPPPRPRAGAKPPVDAAAVEAEVRVLYDRAADPVVTEDQLRAACAKLESLKKGEVVRVAEGVGLVGMGSKTKPVITAAITSRLLDRKGAAVRGQLIDRPTSQAGGMPPVPNAPTPPAGDP